MSESVKNALSFGSVLTIFCFMCVGAVLHQPEPVRDRQALLQCLKLHPARYCHITYNGLRP